MDKDMQTNHKTLVFIHIPKTAGMTLYEVLDRQYSPRHTLQVASGLTKQQWIEMFRGLSEDKKKQIYCIRGHMPFGLHKWLPQPAHHATLLRNPVTRVISDYYHVKRTKRHFIHAKLIRENMSLIDYMKFKLDMNTDNLQVRWIGGFVDFDSVLPPYKGLPAGALERAKSNIDSYFKVCGLMERFDESLLLMKQEFNWGYVFYKKKNYTRKRHQKAAISRSTLSFIERSEELDLELWEYAKKRLEEMLDLSNITPLDVRRFQEWNRVAGLPFYLAGTFRKYIQFP